MKLIKAMLVLGGAGLIGGALFIYLGVFNVAADDPHTQLVYWLMETVRERSIAVRARAIDVPSLDLPAMITAGDPTTMKCVPVVISSLVSMGRRWRRRCIRDRPTWRRSNATIRLRPSGSSSMASR